MRTTGFVAPIRNLAFAGLVTALAAGPAGLGVGVLSALGRRCTFEQDEPLPLPLTFQPLPPNETEESD